VLPGEELIASSTVMSSTSAIVRPLTRTARDSGGSGAAAGLARHVEVGHEDHLQLHRAQALTLGAAALLAVEGEVLGAQAQAAAAGFLCVELADELEGTR